MVDKYNLTPTASPTNTFVAPQSIPNTNAALELAKSLGVIRDTASNYIDEKRKKAEEEGRRKGLLYSALSEKEAISKGIITEFESPWFLKGQREQQGRLSGDTYDAALTKAYQQSGMRDNTNPGAFAAFAEKFRKEYLDKINPDLAKDPDFILGLGSKMTQSEQQLSEMHVSDASTKLREDAVVGTQNEIYNQIVEKISKGPVRPEDIVGPVSLVAARQKTFFLTGKEVSAAKIAAIGQAAIDLNRPELLDMLDHPSHDGTPGPGLTIEGRDKIHDIRQKILAENIRRETYEREQNDRYNKQESEKRMLEGIRKIAAGSTVSEQEIQDGERFDPDFRLKLIAARKSISTDESPKDSYELMRAINLGQIKTTQDVYDYVEANDIQIAGDTVEKAVNKVGQIQDGVYSDPFVKAQADALDGALNPGGMFGGLDGGRAIAEEAKAQFAERVVSEVPQDIKGSQQWRDAIKKIKEEVRKEAEDKKKSNVEVRGAKDEHNAKTSYFPSLQNLQDVATLYNNGETGQLDAVLTKAGVDKDQKSIDKFLTDQKLLLEQGK